MEVVDEELEETLLGLQIEVDELLVEVTRYRSEVPGQVAQALADRLHQSIPCLRPLSPTQADADAPVADTVSMRGTAATLADLAKGLPEMVSRLQQHRLTEAT